MEITNDQFYEDVIKPKLADVARLCEERDDMSIEAFVWYDCTLAETIYLAGESATPTIAMPVFAARAAGNLDNFVFSFVRWMDKNGVAVGSIIQALVNTTLEL